MNVPYTDCWTDLFVCCLKIYELSCQDGLNVLVIALRFKVHNGGWKLLHGSIHENLFLGHNGPHISATLLNLIHYLYNFKILFEFVSVSFQKRLFSNLLYMILKVKLLAHCL